MSGLFRVQAALSGGEKMPAHKLAARMGITSKQFHRRIAKLVTGGHVCRVKQKDSGSSYYWYYLNETQLEAFKVRVARHREALSRIPEAVDVTLATDTNDIHDRIKFLRMLKEKTVFSDHATLALIIEDYERTLRLRRACEQRAEDEDRRGLARKTDFRERRAA